MRLRKKHFAEDARAYLEKMRRKHELWDQGYRCAKRHFDALFRGSRFAEAHVKVYLCGYRAGLKAAKQGDK